MTNQPSMDDQFLRKITLFIEDNLDNEHLSVEDLAAHAGLSRSMLHRKLVKLTGKSASDLITEKRMVKAKEMLENNVATASEIAYKVGFSSPSYFAKVFKSHYHLSPGDVRKGLIPEPETSSGGEQKKLFFRHKSLFLIILLSLLVLVIVFTTYSLLRKQPPADKSIAILPFDNLSSSAENQFFADGIVEDLLSRLSQIEGLRVISRTSSEIFRDRATTIPEIARLLNVSYILEGAIQRETNNIRIHVQLIDAKNDDHILSKEYNRNLKEVFEVQSEIASQIASELSIVLTDRQKDALRQTKTDNPRAFEYYQMGRFHSSKRVIEGYTKSIEYFNKAISEDPAYGLAYAGLSDTYHLMSLQGWMDYEEGRKKATELALKALDLDPDLAEPHAVLGDFYAYSDWDWEKAEKELTQAIKINPNYSTAHQYYSELLAITGNYAKAREHINKAMELDPFSFIIRHFSALYHYDQGNFDKALSENNVCLDLVKDHLGALKLGFYIHVRLGDEETALNYAKKIVERVSPSLVNEADDIFSNEGINGIIHWLIRNTEAADEKARYYALLGDKEKTLENLKQAVDEKAFNLICIASLEYRFVHSDPRYIEVRKKLGLPPLTF